jgi:ATP-dependent Clp protease ATP-binding subunit ClpA
LDAANILKPVLSRSGFQCIGATTIKEYERIEKDAALNRRFQAVKVLEPTVEQTRHILYSLRSTFESYHNLEITAAAIGTAVDLTHRYIYDRYLPDKAIDILDRACAKEVVRITAPKYGSILSSIVNGALVNIGIMKVEAFRRGDIAAEFLLNEVEKAYRNFLLRWINDPTLLPELSLDEEAEEEEKELEEYFRVLPSVDAFATKEREKRIEEIKEKRKRRLEETLAPLSASLYEEMRLLVLGRVDELLFTSQRSMAEIPSFSKKKIGKICDLTRDKNREVISSVLNGLYTERKLDISLYRILLYLTLQWQKPIVKNDLTELFGNELKEEEVSFENFYNYITNIRHQISTRSFAIYEKHMDFIESDIEQREEMYPYLSELDLNRFEVFQDHLIKLKPLMDRTFASSFMRSSRLNDPMRIGVDQRKDIFDLLGFLSTPLGHEVTTKADDPRLIKLAQKFGNFGPLKYQITAPKIRNLISSMTGIPVTSISSQESEKLLNLESTLHRRIIGQDLAVTAIAKAIRRARLGVQDPNRPLACFLFCGPTGVGKTEVTKALADTLFGSEKNMLRLDMSEFMEKFTVSRLIGSPPGYIGYEEGGQLTDYVRTKPYSVILFDEVEKAHPDVLNILLQIMEDGRLTDTQKRLVKFENTLIIMTSNAGSEDILDVLQNENFSELGVYQDTFSKEKETKQSIDKSKNIKVSEDKYGVTYDLLESPIKESFLSDIREGLQKEFFQSFFRKKDYSQLQKLVKEKNKDNLNEDIESLKEKENENFFNQVKEESKKKETELIEQLKSVVLERLNMYFLPEFLNRLDDIIIFLPLRIEELRKICEIMVENLIKRLQKSKLFVVVDENVKFKLSVESYNPAFGARPLRRVIRRSLEDLFCEDMLREPIPPNGRSIFVTLDDDEKIIIEKD